MTWTWLWSRVRLLLQVRQHQVSWVMHGNERGANAAWLCAVEEKSICLQQPGLVFIGMINEWHHFQCRLQCSLDLSCSPDQWESCRNGSNTCKGDFSLSPA